MQHLIDQLREHFPCSYGGPNYRLHALNQLLVVNGNGYSWKDDNSTLEYHCGDTIRSDKPRMSNAELHAAAFERLRRMPEFDPVTVSRSYGHFGLRKALKDIAKEEELANWDLEHGTQEAAMEKVLAEIHSKVKDDDKTWIDIQIWIENQCKRPSFYTLSLDRFSGVTGMDGRTDDDTVRCGFEVLFDGVLTHPQGDGHYQQSNHAHALILLMRFRELFKRVGIWPGTDTVMEHRRKVGDEQLRISMKEHVRNHEIDERVLTDDEYAWYHGLKFDGLTAEEIHLLRQYSFYLRWKDGFDKERTENNNSLDFKRRRAFWQNLKFGELIEGDPSTLWIPEQTVTDEQAIACMRVNHCTFS